MSDEREYVKYQCAVMGCCRQIVNADSNQRFGIWQMRNPQDIHAAILAQSEP